MKMAAVTGKRARTDEASSKESGKKATEDMEQHLVVKNLVPLSPHKQHSTSIEFMRLLLTMPADSLKPPSNVIFVCQRSDNLVDVWKGLVRHNFLSVPVLQKKGHKYYGFIDLADIVNTVVESFGKVPLENSEDYWKMVSEDELFKKKSVNDVMVYPISRRNPFHPINKNYSLFSAIEVLARERGLHRVPIIDDNRKLVGLITQSQVVDFLFKNVNLLGSKKDIPVKLCRGAIRPVFSVKDDETAMSAFKIMTTNGISGIAVVDAEGKLTANISLRDLKAIGTDGRLFWRLYGTVHNFLLKIRKEYAEHDGRPRTVISLRQEDTLETAIRLLSQHNIHRLFVIDEAKKPVGVLSLKDILLEIISDT